jgi:hypothetical protein
MNAALGGVSAGGPGTPKSDVTHSGGGPCALVAVQFSGKVGGVTPSKSSLSEAGSWQGAVHEGAGCGSGVVPAVSLPSI